MFASEYYQQLRGRITRKFMNPLFIGIEGIGGSGKTTLVKNLIKSFNQLGIRVASFKVKWTQNLDNTLRYCKLKRRGPISEKYVRGIHQLLRQR